MMKVGNKKWLLVGVVVFAMVFSGMYMVMFSGSASAPEVPITTGYRANLIKDAQYIGPADPNQEIWVTISLKWKNDEELN
ncbi:MAG: hypothetical protein GXO25_00550, partial [Euryarchaeota archaeon]|nr:hypothetical protein [Euryarchaeota archaeon]